MKPEVQVIPNPVVGRRYGFASLAFFLLVLLPGNFAVLWAWPGLACAGVAWSYFRGGARLYGKKQGRVSPFSALLLLPTRAGQWASLVYYRRKTTLCDEVIPGLYLGRQPTRSEAEDLVNMGIRRVLDVTAEFSRPAPFASLCYLNLAIPDLTAPTPEQLRKGVAFIREGLEAGESVYVHCKVGYSRSGTLVGAALVSLGIAESPADAIELLEKRRPGIVLRPEARTALAALPDSSGNPVQFIGKASEYNK